jgi:hypothetical protein
MKKILKIVGFSVLGLIVLVIGIAVLVSVFVPEEELEKVAAERAKTEQQTAPEENPPPEDSRPPVERMAEKDAYNIKASTWDQTPAEQGLKVGDWVTIVGYTGGLIGAEAIGTNGVITGWKWTHNKIWGDQAFVAIVSQPTGLSAPADRIVNIVGFVEKPSSNREVARINEAYVKKWHEEKKGLVRVTGEISDISEPDPTNRYPGQWGMNLKTSVFVELVE